MAKVLATGNTEQAARRHGHEVLAAEHVQHLAVHKPTEVVAHIDHHTLTTLVLGVEVDRQLAEAVRAHIEDVDVAQAATTGALHIGPAITHPLAIEQTRCGTGGDRAYDRDAASANRRRHRQAGAFADPVQQQAAQVHASTDAASLDGQQGVARLDCAFDVGRSQRSHFTHDQAPTRVLCRPIKAQPQVADARRGHRSKPLDGTAHAEVGGVEFAQHEVDDTPQFVRRARPLGKGLEPCAQNRPVQAVEGGVIEAAIDCRPGLVEDHLLFSVEADDHLATDLECFGTGALQGRDADASSVQEIKLFGARIE